MEDEEDIQSQNSGESGSPATSRSDGRITVTVASVPPSSQGSLTLALPSQQPMQQQQQQLQQSSRPSGKSGGGGGGGGGGSGGREDCWSEGATSVLIDAWGERYLELSRGNLKQNHWKDVADIVGSLDNSSKTPKTDIQCKNRIDTVKKKYKMEKAKIAAGGGPSKWPFYERLDRLIGSTAKLTPASGGSSGGGAGSSGGMTSSQRVPMGIPLGARSNPNLRHQQQQHHLQKHKPPIRKRPVASDSESEPELSPDSADDFPPVTYERNKRPRSHNQNDFGGGGRPGTNTGKDAIMEKRSAKDKNFGNSVKDLAWAIMKFGEAYEQAESSKLQQLVDMEKQRMKFAKELEVQRMQFFMKTQLELSQLHNNHHRRSGNGRSNHHRSSINTATNNNDHSDSSN